VDSASASTWPSFCGFGHSLHVAGKIKEKEKPTGVEPLMWGGRERRLLDVAFAPALGFGMTLD
jgi:hypothetical protein